MSYTYLIGWSDLDRWYYRISKVVDKISATKQEKYWGNKGFDSHDDAVKTIKRMYNDGTPMYKIAEELKIDPITVSKKVRL